MRGYLSPQTGRAGGAHTVATWCPVWPRECNSLGSERHCGSVGVAIVTRAKEFILEQSRFMLARTMLRKSSYRFVVACLTSVPCLAILPAQVQQEHEQAQPTLRVFLLAGQSNMEGQAVVDLDHEEHYNGGRGTLQQVMATAKDKEQYAHLKDEDGNWTERSDVVVWYRAGGKDLKAGELSIGYAVYGGRHHFGPEMQFGHVLGDYFDEPVLLVKTAWGGKRVPRAVPPPSAKGPTGPYYTRMITEYREALRSIGEHFPKYAKHRPQLTGLVWFQGWNDMVDKAATASYADNLAHLIRDVRSELQAPKLPVVVAETGNASSEVFRKAQADGAARPEFRGNVEFITTRSFMRKPENSPNTGHLHHWFGNAESYFLIGNKMGESMCGLLRSNR